jgi:hypothetical protein
MDWFIRELRLFKDSPEHKSRPIGWFRQYKARVLPASQGLVQLGICRPRFHGGRIANVIWVGIAIRYNLKAMPGL